MGGHGTIGPLLSCVTGIDDQHALYMRKRQFAKSGAEIEK